MIISHTSCHLDTACKFKYVRRHLSKRDADHDAKRDPNGEIAFEDTHVIAA
jgi:hypothetical protein